MKRLVHEVKRKDKSLVDVQIVTSGGMTVQPESIVVRKDGFICHCDGLNGDSKNDMKYGAHSSAFVNTGNGLQPIAVQKSISAHGPDWKTKLDPDGEGSLFVAAFENDPGPTLRFYEPTPLPAPL